MADTEKFAVQIRLGDKTYQPGDDVPVGGRNGLDPEEAKRISRHFGRPAGEKPTENDKLKKLQAENAALSKAIDKLQAEKADQAKQIGDLQAENADLVAKLVEKPAPVAGEGNNQAGNGG